MRALRRGLVLLVLLGVVLVVADRVGAWGAQRVVADQVEEELASHDVDSSSPEVSVRGVPFLTQVAAGRYEEVTILLREVGSGGVRLSQVELVATGVTASARSLAAREGPIDAERVDGRATVGYGAVAELAGMDDLELTAGDSGAIAIRLRAELLGEQVVLAGAAELVVTGEAANTLRLQVLDLAVEDGENLPPEVDPVVEDVAQQLTLEVPLPPLPYELTVESVTAEPSGLVVHLSAEDVPLVQ